MGHKISRDVFIVLQHVSRTNEKLRVALRAVSSSRHYHLNKLFFSRIQISDSGLQAAIF